MSSHSVFVVSLEGKPVTPTTPAKARKLLRGGVAQPVWSKFGTFGIRLLVPTRPETPVTTLGVDQGTKFEGYAVVCGRENPLSLKVDLPDKKKIVKKVRERATLRRARRFRKCWRRPARFDNRKRDAFLAPSQGVVVASRLKVLKALLGMFPVTLVGFEDVRFHHAKYKWGANFSTVEIGKARIKAFLEAAGTNVSLYRGFETQELRQQYGYRKTSDKGADRFEAHCSDALTLACAVSLGEPVPPGLFLVVDDTYRAVRRRLHDTQPAPGGVRSAYSRGTVFGVRKGLLIGAANGKTGQLCGEYQGGYRYTDALGKRQSTRSLQWVSTHFRLKPQTLVAGGNHKDGVSPSIQTRPKR